jgi:hypothetical protein
VPAPTAIPPTLRNRPFTNVEAAAAGISASALRRSRFLRLHQTVWICADVELTDLLRFDAARLALPDGAIGSHHTSGTILGLPVPNMKRPQFWLPESAKGLTYRGIRTHWYQEVPASNHVDGRIVTDAGKTFIDLATQLNVVDLVVFGDAAIRSGLATPDELERLARERGRRNIRKARQAAALVREQVDSPPETRLRLLLVFAGLPEPQVGIEVHDANGGWLAVPDLSYPEYKIAIEYDGLHHLLNRRQRASDILRRENLVNDGWIVIEVLADHLAHQPELTIMRILDALHERRHPMAPRWPTGGWRPYFS